MSKPRYFMPKTSLDVQFLEACRFKSLEAVRDLFAMGANPYTINSKGETSLLRAAANGSDPRIVRWVHSLGGFEINQTPRSKIGILHEFAIHGFVENMEWALNAGIDPDSADGTRWTPLHYAFHYNRPEVVPLLIDAGASVNATTNADETPLHLLHDENTGLQRLLDAGASIDARNRWGDTPLIKTARAGDALLAQTLVEYGADINAQAHDGATALLAAAQKKHFEIVALLLAAGADVDVATDRGSTLKTLSKKNSELRRLLDAREARAAVMAAAIRRGASPS